MSRSSTKTSASRFELVGADTPAALAVCRELFVEYQRALGVSLCFQGFDAELAGLPGEYAPPRGRLYLALVAGRPAGCASLLPLFRHDAEMKRLYVRPAHRGSGLGRLLATRIIEEARVLGYDHVKLDTLPQMRAAQGLYGDLGFRDTAAYNDNPVSGVRFLALSLRSVR